MRHPPIKTLSVTDAAYIAGLIDADGTVTMTRKSQPTSATALHMPMVLVVNGNLPLIQWLKETIGGGTAYEVKTRPTRPDQSAAHWNKVHRYQLLSGRAQQLLRQCRPYMRIKAAHADLVLQVAIKGINFKCLASEEQRLASLEVLQKVR